MQRERDTWFAYAAQALFGFVLYGSGSITVLVRSELGLGYLAGGLLPALFTSGAIAGAGLTGWLLRAGARGGRELGLLGGAAGGMGAAALVLALPGLGAAAAGLAVGGIAGGMVPPTGAILLAARHGEQSGRALLEVNVLAGLAGVVAGATLSLASLAGSWRLALVVPVLAGVALAALGTRLQQRNPAPSADVVPAPARAVGRLPRAARWYVVVAVCAGVVEFSVLYWAADLVATAAGLSSTAAAGTLVAFTGGLVVGRAGLSVVARTGEANRRILQASLLVAAAGAAALVLAGRPGPAVAALALVGLGGAALYPLSLALAVRAAAGAGARASSLLSIGVGVASLVAPVVLAAGADAVGLRAAFTAVPVAAVVGFLAARRAARAEGAPPSGARADAGAVNR